MSPKALQHAGATPYSEEASAARVRCYPGSDRQPIVAGFEQRADAERFLQEWKDHLQKFGLELHPDKTRLIEFGCHATENRKQRCEGKPEVFNFLSFAHMCGKT